MILKPQDIGFIFVLIILLFKRDPKLFALAGILSLALSIPLFAKWIFFTAERLTWYAGAFIAISIVLNLIELRKK